MSEPHHIFPLRVYYEDTDAAGIVYYANYLKYAERARTELVRGVGGDHRTYMEQDGIMFAVRSVQADYLRPALLDDCLEVHTTMQDVRGASLQVSQVVMRDTEELVAMSVRLACMTMDGRPARIPTALRDALQNLISTH